MTTLYHYSHSQSLSPVDSVKIVLQNKVIRGM